jgi:hypothetical protein
MRRLFVIAIALCGCRDPELDQVRAIKEEVCKCKSVDCGETAMQKLRPRDKPSAREQALANDMLNCMSRLYLKERPETDPDQPTSPGSGDPASARRP